MLPPLLSIDARTYRLFNSYLVSDQLIRGFDSTGGMRSVGWLCVGVACVVCAMLSKEQGITALGVWLAQDFWTRWNKLV